MCPVRGRRLSRTRRGSGALRDRGDPEQGLLRPEAGGLQDLGAELDPTRPRASRRPTAHTFLQVHRHLRSTRRFYTRKSFQLKSPCSHQIRKPIISAKNPQ